MLRRFLLTSGVTLLLALGGLSTTPAQAAPAVAAPSITTQLDGRAVTNGTTDWDDCLIVTAETLNVYANSTGLTRVDRLYQSEKVLNWARENGRYLVVYDERNGWISADPRWTDPTSC